MDELTILSVYAHKVKQETEEKRTVFSGREPRPAASFPFPLST